MKKIVKAYDLDIIVEQTENTMTIQNSSGLFTSKSKSTGSNRKVFDGLL
jgi:hypothetical protein